MGRYTIHQKDRNQDALVKWLEDRGCVYEHIGKPVDGLLCVPTRRGAVTVPVEWKMPRRALERSQMAFIDKWKAPVYVLRSEVECAAMLAEVQR